MGPIRHKTVMKQEAMVTKVTSDPLQRHNSLSISANNKFLTQKNVTHL